MGLVSGDSLDGRKAREKPVGTARRIVSAEFLVELRPATRRSAALGKSPHLEDPDSVVKRNRNHVT